MGFPHWHSPIPWPARAAPWRGRQREGKMSAGRQRNHYRQQCSPVSTQSISCSKGTQVSEMLLQPREVTGAQHSMPEVARAQVSGSSVSHPSLSARIRRAEPGGAGPGPHRFSRLATARLHCLAQGEMG